MTVNVENYNQAKTRFQVRIANIEGQIKHNGAYIYRQDLIWINPLEGGWRKCE